MLFKSKSNAKSLSTENILWNSFISIIAANDQSSIPEYLRKVAIVFWYDAEVNNGGHAAFFENYPSISYVELASALEDVGADDFVCNLHKAFLFGENDDYITADRIFGDILPDLTSRLRCYIIGHAYDLKLGEPANLQL